MLTEGRFEFGIGTGLPQATIQAAQELGLPLRSGAERLDAVRETIDHLHTLDGDTHTPVLIAAGGPRARALAAEKADIVTLAAAPLTLLRGNTQQMAGELQRRREDLAVSYVCVNAAFYEQLAPVVEFLTGH